MASILEQTVAPVAAPRGALFDADGKSRQNGISDPRWPSSYDEFIDRFVNIENGDVEQLERDFGQSRLRAFHDNYGAFAGRMRPQGFLSIITADINTRGVGSRKRRDDLKRILHGITVFAWDQMKRPPSRNRLRPFDHLAVPFSYRVTVTLGFGATLFQDRFGVDRFDVRAFKPHSLRTMPSLVGDLPSFNSGLETCDLLVLVQSDHEYVNVAVTRAFAQYVDPQLTVRRIERGFARPDVREFLRFDDGVANLKDESEIDKLVFVSPTDDEPEWCVGGSYVVWRKIRENLFSWESISEAQQERMIGRRKEDGAPLSSEVDPNDPRTPVFGTPTGGRDVSFDAHIRKVQPRRSGKDFMGVVDLDRRLLRRGYPYFDGLAGNGVDAGLQFLAFMRDIRSQFEWISQQWQLNPDFPFPNAGADALFAQRILETVAGGYYFCPPAPAPPRNGESVQTTDDFFGSAMFL